MVNYQEMPVDKRRSLLKTNTGSVVSVGTVELEKALIKHQLKHLTKMGIINCAGQALDVNQQVGAALFALGSSPDSSIG